MSWATKISVKEIKKHIKTRPDEGLVGDLEYFISELHFVFEDFEKDFQYLKKCAFYAAEELGRRNRKSKKKTK